VTSRRGARRTAIDILYQADITASDPRSVLASWAEAGREVPAFAAELVAGVEEHQPEIDLLLEEHTQGWTVGRMAALDRTILRVAVFELLHRPDVPVSVAIAEAVQTASDLSAEQASRFVNGILGRIAADRVSAAREDPAEEP
jgi:transcription antitermination protein NusB